MRQGIVPSIFLYMFVLGWFGIVSLVTNPFRMIFDVFQYIRAEIRLGGFGKAVTIVASPVFWFYVRY